MLTYIQGPWKRFILNDLENILVCIMKKTYPKIRIYNKENPLLE